VRKKLLVLSLLLISGASAEEVPEVQVTATRVEVPVEHVGDDVDIITQEEIKKYGFTSVADVLKYVAGVHISSNGGFGQTASVYMLGLPTKHILVMIDGVPINDPSSVDSQANFAYIDLNNVERIEVLKGAQGALYGSEAIAGVINIITKKPQTGVHGSAHVEAGSFKTKKYGATLSTKTENYSLKVSHNVVDTDGFTAQAPKGEDISAFENDAYTNKTTNVQLGLNLNDSNSIDLAYTYIDANAEYDTYQNPNALANSTTKDSFASVNFNHIDSYNELNAYVKRSVFKREFITAFGNAPFDGQVDEYGINSKIPYGIEDFILIGTDYKNFAHTNNINKEFNNQGFFATNNNTFEGMMGGTTIVTESLRYDTYSTFENEFTGKIGLKHIHENIKGLVSSVNYGTAYTVPTLYQLYAPAFTFNGFTSPVGNENLNPETTKSFDATLAYKDFSVTYFNNKIDNLIEYTNGYNNVEGTSQISGIEVAYTTEILSNLNLSMNYTNLLKAEDKNGKQLKRRATNTFKTALDYYGIENLHLGADLEYVGSRTDIIFNPDYTTSDAETGKYTVVNMSADYQVTQAFQVYGKIVNLTDEKYQTVYGYATSPRAFYAGVRAKF